VSADDFASILSRWRKITDAATPSPWKVEAKHGRDIADEAWSEVRIKAPDGSDIASTYISHLLENYNADEDEELIVTARTAMPRLLAAVEAALKPHHPTIRRQGWPPTCNYDNRRWPCPEVKAITTALTGKETGDE